METKLRIYRNKYRLTQKKLAQMVGVQRTTISSIELRKRIPSLKLACSLAKVFNTKVEILFPVDTSSILSSLKVKTVRQVLRELGDEIHEHDKVEFS